jgi:hypothetical protein
MSDARRPVSSGRGAPPPRRADNAPVPASAKDVSREPEPAAQPPRRSTVVSPATANDAQPTTSARDERRSAATKPPRTRAPWWLRVVAWVVAVPLGLALVGVPAHEADYLSNQKLLDVVIGDDLGRYLPLLIIVVLWAVVTALLVQLIVEGGGWVLRRRQRSARTPAAGPTGT